MEDAKGTLADPVRFRRAIYALLITIAAAAAAGRILAAAFVLDPALHRDENDPNDVRRPWPSQKPTPTPMFGSNDRSRWATVRALVDEGTYAVGRRDSAAVMETNPYGDEGIVFEDGWKTSDKVLLKRDERQEFYSSKPPLLPTLAAGEYWLLKNLFGWSIVEQRWLVVRTILFTMNWLPFVIYLMLLSRLAERFGVTDWGRLYVVAAGCFGTLLTPFLVTFNNHTVASCCALFALYPALAILNVPASPRLRVSASHFLLSGFFAGFTAAVELPAASFLALLFLILLWRAPGRTLAFFVPAAAVPVAALLLTNYLALGEFAPAYSKLGTPAYQYAGSHWLNPDDSKRGIDFLQEPKTLYAFHFLLGHHGLFSLFPISLLSLAGVIVGLRREKESPHNPVLGGQGKDTAFPWPLPFMTAFLLVVVIGFYIVMTHNYGGWTSGPRWLMWLTPFLLLTMLPVADWLGGRRWGRVLAYLLLAVSVVSANYPALNPWRHPWISDFLEALGWLQY